MKASILLTGLLAALSESLAVGPINTPSLSIRASPISNLPGKTIQCGGKNARAASYSVSDIQKAAEASLQHVVDKTVVPPNNYPKFYKYTDEGVKLDPNACKKGDDLYEFPITRGVYTGGQDITQIADRVIIKRKGKNAMYCGLVTHLGAAGNGFVSCSG